MGLGGLRGEGVPAPPRCGLWDVGGDLGWFRGSRPGLGVQRGHTDGTPGSLGSTAVRSFFTLFWPLLLFKLSQTTGEFPP